MTFGEQNSLQQSFRLLDEAYGAGVNFIDTAEMYSFRIVSCLSCPLFARGVYLVFFFFFFIIWSSVVRISEPYRFLLGCCFRYPVPQRRATQGRSEQYIGRWLKERKVPRERVVLATKVGCCLSLVCSSCFRFEARFPWFKRGPQFV